MRTCSYCLLSANRWASSELADSSANHKLRGQNSLAESHLRMMQPLEKHLHTGLANRFFVDADS